jgi:hypothetical protein
MSVIEDIAHRPKTGVPGTSRGMSASGPNWKWPSELQLGKY